MIWLKPFTDAVCQFHHFLMDLIVNPHFAPYLIDAALSFLFAHTLTTFLPAKFFLLAFFSPVIPKPANQHVLSSTQSVTTSLKVLDNTWLKHNEKSRRKNTLGCCQRGLCDSKCPVPINRGERVVSVTHDSEGKTTAILERQRLYTLSSPFRSDPIDTRIIPQARVFS